VTPEPGFDNATAPTDALRHRVLQAARAARLPGESLRRVEPISAAEAFSRAADAFNGLLGALDTNAWRLPVLRDLDVQGLVGHLTGVERDVCRSIDGDAGVADADHVASTQQSAHRQSGRTPAQTRREWRAAVDETLARVGLGGAGLDPAAPVAIHGMRLPLAALLVVRAFELWTHENDIRRAAGWPASVPDAATLQLMTALAVRLLPDVAARAKLPVHPTELHLVLTGDGGGTWDLSLGGTGRRRAPITIVTDAIAFCRLVANRLDPTELDAHTTGDPDGVRQVLFAATTMALD
jgi:uncharacterized protein (TIGR03083 family)